MSIRMLKRYARNPILKPIKSNAWEKYVYNPAAVFLENKVHIVYRAFGKDRISRMGYARSSDGVTIDKRSSRPIFVPKDKSELLATQIHNSGVEDPRLTRIEDRIYMTYASVNGRIAQVALASIKVDDFLHQRWNWKRHGLLFPGWDDRNSVLFPCKIKGKYVIYHRLKPNIWVSYSNDLKKWSEPKVVMEPRKNSWDSFKIGAAAPPLRLRNCWLLIYHGVEPTIKGLVYSVGMALIDLKDPQKVLYRCVKPILKPIKDYERKGQVPNVIFPCGAVIIKEKLYVYYGGADTVICVATAKLSDIIPKKFL